MQIALIGSGEPLQNDIEDLARGCGAVIAKLGHTLVCGGRGGVMEAASEGAASEGGTVVGILPSLDASEGNVHLTASVCTGMGEARNAIVVASGTIVVAFPGSYGTLSELSFAAKWGKDIIIVRKDAFLYDVEHVLAGKSVKYADTLEDITSQLSEYHGT